MKKIISAVICAALSVSLLAGAAFADAGLSNFDKKNVYETGRFADVAGGDWFNESVGAAYEYGLLLGVSQNEFGAGSNVTIAEALTMAARLHSIYTTGSDEFAESEPWYQTYVDYCVANGIINAGRFENFDLNATRTQIASIFAKALPAEALPVINTVEGDSIADLDGNADNTDIYKLYRAGIFTGESATGDFGPARSILRTEIAAVVTRMAVPALRKSFTLVKYSENTGVKTDAQVIDALKLGRDTIGDAQKIAGNVQLTLDAGQASLAQAQLMPDGAAKTAALASASAQINMALNYKTIAMQDTLVAAKHAENVMNFCQDKPEYADIYAKAKTAFDSCTTASQLISGFGTNSQASLWTTALSVMQDASVAFRQALGE